MNQEPLVSIIVPNYNYAHFLKQRIESVLCQTYTNIEVILLDDASTDESLQIIDYYRRNPVVSHIEINSKNSGSPFVQWGKGLSLARGKYVWIAESDDYAELSFLATAVPLMEENADAALCFVGSYCVDEAGDRVKVDYDRWSKRQYSCKEGYKIVEGNTYIQRNMYWRCYVYNASCVLFRREFAERIDKNICFSMKSSGDWLFWTEMAYQGKVIEIYKKLNYFRFHHSTSVQARKSGIAWEEDFRVLRQIEKRFPQISVYKKTLRRGIFYKKIKRSKMNRITKLLLLEQLKEELGGGYGAYLTERINKYLSSIIPWLLTEVRERL